MNKISPQLFIERCIEENVLTLTLNKTHIKINGECITIPYLFNSDSVATTKPYTFDTKLLTNHEYKEFLTEAFISVMLKHNIKFDMLFSSSDNGSSIIKAIIMNISGLNAGAIKNPIIGLNSIVGYPLRRKILIIETDICKIEKSIKYIKSQNKLPIAVIIPFDNKLKKSQDSISIQELSDKYNIPILSIFNIDDLLVYLKYSGLNNIYKDIVKFQLENGYSFKYDSDYISSYKESVINKGSTEAVNRDTDTINEITRENLQGKEGIKIFTEPLNCVFSRDPIKLLSINGVELDKDTLEILESRSIRATQKFMELFDMDHTDVEKCTKEIKCSSKQEDGIFYFVSSDFLEDEPSIIKMINDCTKDMRKRELTRRSMGPFNCLLEKNLKRDEVNKCKEITSNDEKLPLDNESIQQIIDEHLSERKERTKEYSVDSVSESISSENFIFDDMYFISRHNEKLLSLDFIKDRIEKLNIKINKLNKKSKFSEKINLRMLSLTNEIDFLTYISIKLFNK